MRGALYSRIIVATLIFILCLPVIAGAKDRTLLFKNATSRHIQFALVFKDQSGKWRKAGWFTVAPRGTEELQDYFAGDKVYVYGEDVNSDHAWPAQSRKQGLTQSVRSDSFNVDANIRFGALKYFSTMNVGSYSRYTWTFK